MRKSLTPLGETEMEILHHIWALGEASVAEVQEKILQDRKVAYTTVMTVMKNLADKGYLKYKKKGLAYIYSPAKQPDDVRFFLINRLIDKVFHGSSSALVQTLIKSENLSKKEKENIRKTIDEMEE
ncbi:MAG: BlaI/MecI/CopY family transcriptional regulator [Balneolaceae bacterium]